MKQYFLILSLAYCSCAGNESKHALQNNSGNSDSTRMPVVNQTTEKATWITSFRSFRDAVYHHDKAKARSFVSLPMQGETNDVWYLVYAGNDKKLSQLNGNAKPFTEADFDLYFSKLFPKEFFTALLKIKSEELYKTGSAETKDLHEGNTTYKLYATFDEATQKLTLNLSLSTGLNDEKGKPEDGVESNIIYSLDVENNAELKLKKVNLAG